MVRGRGVKTVFASAPLLAALAVGGGATAVQPTLEPSGIILLRVGRLSSIAYCSLREELYAVDSLSGDILVGRTDGRGFTRLKAWRSRRINSIAVGSDGELFVTDLRGPGVSRLDAKGTERARIEISGTDVDHPLGKIRVGASGKLYVAERSGCRVFILDPSLRSYEVRHLRSSPDTLALQDVAVDEDGRLFVVSSRGEVVRRYDSDGTYVDGFGTHGPTADRFSFPVACARDGDGFFWVVDSFQHSVKVFDDEGRFVCSLLDMDRTGDGLFFPVDIAFVGGGEVAVGDKGTSSIKLFKVAGLR